MKLLKKMLMKKKIHESELFTYWSEWSGQLVYHIWHLFLILLYHFLIICRTSNNRTASSVGTDWYNIALKLDWWNIWTEQKQYIHGYARMRDDCTQIELYENWMKILWLFYWYFTIIWNLNQVTNHFRMGGGEDNLELHYQH